MRLNLVLELLDVPGQLLDALDPIGKLGANIVAVIHQRDVKTERGTIPVHISIEGDEETLKRVLKSIEEMNIQTERKQIIEQLSQINDINILNAIKNLLAFASNKEKVFDTIVSDEQKAAVRNRVKEYETNPDNVLTWNDIESKLKNH